MRITSYFTLIACLFLSMQCNTNNKETENTLNEIQTLDYPHYSIAVNISPEKVYIEVNRKLTVPKNSISEKEIIMI